MASAFQNSINGTFEQSHCSKDIDEERSHKLLKNQEEPEDEHTKQTNCLSKCLRSISAGQYSTKLYSSDGEESHSSSFGGIITILIAIIVLSYATLVTISIVKKDTYILDQESGEIKTTINGVN